MEENRKMSDELSRTKKEIAADIELRLAEAKKTNAEARKTEAEAFKEELEANKMYEDDQKRKACDKENHLFRFSGEVRGASVQSCISTLTQWSRLDPKCDIEIIFSSPGGSIIDGFELFDFIQHLRSKGHKITTGTLGMAASMAGILLQAGDVRWVGYQAWIMIHRAAFGAFGKTYEVEDEVEFVKRIEGRILDIFTARSKLTKPKIKRNWDRKDWWISADEAVELELVDEIRAIMPEQKEGIENAKSQNKTSSKSKK